MREIKFRGKCKRNNEWIYGLVGYCNFNRGVERAIIQKTDLGSIIPERTVDNTISQYTGLHDKNGKEIYEGDIVYGWLCYTEEDMAYIEYQEETMSFVTIPAFEKWSGRYFELCDGNDVEVIGNIYDNPELLRGEKE